jgi:hypothetical protein
MFKRSIRLTVGLGILAGVLSLGCAQQQFLNEDLLSALGFGSQAAELPGDAPGLLVRVENRTNRWIRVQVGYRDGDDNVETFTTTVRPLDATGQLLVCPIAEITMGDVSNLQSSGARVYLGDNITSSAQLDSMPFIEVDPFGVLLQEAINYNCGDGIVFTVQASTDSQSGYQAFAFIRRADSQN